MAGLQGMCTYTAVSPEIPRSGWGAIRPKESQKTPGWEAQGTLTGKRLRTQLSLRSWTQS